MLSVSSALLKVGSSGGNNMAENKRIRLEPHIECYLLSHAKRVLGKPASKVTPADLTTLANAIIYEHKLAHGAAQKIPFAKIFSWLTNLVPGSSKVIPLNAAEPQALAAAEKPADNFDFDADLGDLYEDAA
jgi:hypothetical protein